MSYKAVKGTRDFYPEQMEARRKVFDLLRENAIKYGFKEVESPAFESIKLLTAKSGDEIKSQIFVMEKRSNEEIGLRFDITVPLTRMFIEKQKEIPKPVKWFYISRMWRYEAPQKGRLREFYQFGVELFGSNKVQADAEVIALAIDNLVSLGLTEKDFTMMISNRDLIQGFLENIGVKKVGETLRVLDKRGKITEEEFEKELDFLPKDKIKKINKFLKCESVAEAAKQANDKGKEGAKELKQMLSILKSMGKEKYIKFSPEIARGLAYYTGTVFECFDKKGKFRAILGGGRYDKMVEQFGGQPCPATGFAMGDVVLELFLRDKKLWKDSSEGVDYYVAPVNADYIEKAIEIAQLLREKNSVDIDLMERKLGKQFSYADSIKAKKVVIIGDETKKGNVKIKDMASGKEEEVKISKLK